LSKLKHRFLRAEEKFPEIHEEPVEAVANHLQKNYWLGMVAALLCAVGMWFYVNHILVPHQRADAEAHERPRGNLSDLYPRWLGSRELLLHHRNPYSPEITREIQIGYYGRELDPNRPMDPRDKQGFAYPLYVAFLLVPTLGMRFEWVVYGFKCLLLVVTAASVPLWLRVIGWKLPASGIFIAIALTLGCFPAVQGFKLQQLSLLVAGILAAACALLVSGFPATSGVLLAIATIKPQLVLPAIVVMLLWTCSDWRRRQRLFWGFAATMLVLLVASEMALPGWVGNFLSATREYRQYAGGMSMLQVLLSLRLGRVASALAATAVAAVCWQFRREEAATKQFALMMALTLLVTVIIIPMFAPYNYVLVLPAILLIAQDWQALWAHGVGSRTGLVLAALAVAWPWFAALGLAAASLIFSANAVQREWWLPLYTSAKLPMPLVGVIPLSFLVAWHWRKPSGGGDWATSAGKGVVAGYDSGASLALREGKD
jgi:hypothetical protein